MSVLDGIRSSSSLTLSTVLPHSNYASGQPMASGSYCFLSFVQWKKKPKRFLAGPRLLHPGVRLDRTAGLFL